ncbi:L,D-transpeptidase family protein [Candidatus Falkowbacteria bacterium]|jgi:hypothetical protein|nr:L,D-transpeptidase family protein [Candidatus Falkowbacteria bacterium]MBT7006881.1 L,D-transpeptidase family protein [Candidatus Falkowbacteria bacterium]
MKNKINLNNFSVLLLLFLLAVSGGAFLFLTPAQAEDNLDMMVYDWETLNSEDSFSLIDSDYTGSADFDLIDLEGDGQLEIVVGFGDNLYPEIKLFRGDGSIVRSFHPYPIGFTGGLSVVAYDLDNDNKEEIIVAPKAGGGPQVRIFDTYGNPKFVPSFFAADKDYRLGLDLAVGDINNDGTVEILVSGIKDDHGFIKYFNKYGQEIFNEIKVDLQDTYEAPKIAAIDLGSDGISEIIVGLGSGNKPLVKLLRQDGSVIAEFLAYAESFLGGVNFAVTKDRQENLIVTGASFSGGPHVRFISSYGHIRKAPAFFSHEPGFRGGVNVEIGDIDGDGQDELVALPQYFKPSAYLKYIDIDLSDQILSQYQNGRLVSAHQISSGRKGMETPQGEFSIFQKNPRAYSASYGLYMPFWMSFKPSYGLHELPEWPNGYKEGEDHLGIPVSHGCVRLGVGAAESVYNWAPIGTKVLIHE